MTSQPTSSYEERFDASYERILNVAHNGLHFFDRFYDNFISASNEVKEKFKYTNMDIQKRMLKKSFYGLIVFYASNHADSYLEKIAIRHDKDHLDIHPRLYDLWLEELIRTVEECDPLFDDDTELAWRLVMSTGITYMKFKFSHH